MAPRVNSYTISILFLLSSVLSFCVSFAALWRWRWIQYFYSISISFLLYFSLSYILMRIEELTNGAISRRYLETWIGQVSDAFQEMALRVSFYTISILFYYLLSFLLVFHLRHSEDGAEFNIFILSLSFSYRLLSLSYLFYEFKSFKKRFPIFID